ncbi:MAG: hypothetical protein WA825_07900 [Steroidobacteraceae bacterium]
MHKTATTIASIAVAFLGAGIAGCETQLPVGYRMTRLSNTDQPIGRVCMVNDHNCLSMMTEPPHTCLISKGDCDTNGNIQSLNLSTGATVEPGVRFTIPQSQR